MYEIGLIAVGAVFGGLTAFVLVNAAMVANRGKASDAAQDAALSELALEQYSAGYRTGYARGRLGAALPDVELLSDLWGKHAGHAETCDAHIDGFEDGQCTCGFGCADEAVGNIALAWREDT